MTTSSHRFRHLLTALACVPPLIAVLRAATAEPLPLPPGPAPAIATAIAQSLAAAEPAARARSRQAFPGDHWSSDDDFHNHEARLARTLAARYGLALGHVFAVLDADLRSHRIPDRKSTASPCKPRPFYE